jgi:DNA-binding transcriptional MerR regulator
MTVSGQMTTTAHAPAPRLHTIGSVCRRLQSDFPDISISKIRYLEDQGLLSPKRTRGGYRLFGEDDIERLETILRLQRDEFLPLRVIRQELASPSSSERRRRRAGLDAQESAIGVEELCRRAGITPAQARELAEYGLLEPPLTEADVDTAAVCARLVAAGADVRHLRKFATAAGNQADLLEALLPKLRSRNPEARRGAVEELHGLAELAQELNQLLFWRALRHRMPQ